MFIFDLALALSSMFVMPWDKIKFSKFWEFFSQFESVNGGVDSYGVK